MGVRRAMLLLCVMNQSEALDAAERLSLLVVDDDAAVLKVTTRALQRRGYRVVACSSGEQALEQLTQAVFDCMVTDVQMPGMNGLRLLRAVRDRDLDLPVLLMTGNPDLETAASAVEYGAFQYLIKPVENHELSQSVERAAMAGRLARARREYVEQHGSGTIIAADRAGVDATLDRALTSLWMAYQPIFDAKHGAVFAQEALLRSDEPSLPDARAVLLAAEHGERLFEVGRWVRDAVAAAVTRTAASAQIFFMNVHPRDLNDPSLFETNGMLSRAAHRIVLEVTERASLEHLPDLGKKVAALRAMGFRIAVDNLGTGYAGLATFLRLEPEFVKLDMSLVRDLHRDDARRKIVSSLIELCHEMGKTVIAEGIEQAAECAALKELGCDLLQGYWLGSPAPLLERLAADF